MLITSTQAKAIRRKQADKKLTAKQAGEEIGVTQVTYRKIRDGGEVKPSIYQKSHGNGLLKIIRKERPNRNTILHLQISHVVLYHWGLINRSS